MGLLYPLMGLLIASLVNAVPSDAAFHPARAVCDMAEADLSGSGREHCVERTLRLGCARDDEGARAAGDARHWRAMAARCRNLAAWQNDDARNVLLRLADEYEERARRAETRRG